MPIVSLKEGIMTNVTEIAPDIYRISTYNANYKLQFNQFLVKDDEPLLFHTGMKGEFPLVAALVNVTDFAIRAPRWILSEDVLETGKSRFRLFATYHLPHSWDAGMLFEETNRTLFCSG